MHGKPDDRTVHPFVFLCALLLVTGISGVPLCAQTNGVGTAVDIFRFPLAPETRPRFNEICALLAGHPVIKGTFEQTKTILRLNRSLISKGNFIITAEQGMVWETLTPFPSTIAVGTDYLIQSNPSGSKTKLDASGNATFLRLAETIRAVFSGNSQKLADNFETYFTEQEGGWLLGLIPSEQSIRSFAARILMNGDSVIRSIILYEQNGDVIRYTLSNHTFPGALTLHEQALFAVQ